jgi:hypothetical protein
VLIEDPLHVFGTGHVHNTEAERMTPLIPQNSREHHRSKWDEGLTERIIGTKVGQPADVDMGIHVDPSGEKSGHWLHKYYARGVTGRLVTIARFRDIVEVFQNQAGMQRLPL